MIPSSDVYEAVWKILTGLLLGGLLGGLGVGLLVWSVWQRLTRRPRVLLTSDGTPLTVLKEPVPAPREGSRQPKPATGNPDKKTDTTQKVPGPKPPARPRAERPTA